MKKTYCASLALLLLLLAPNGFSREPETVGPPVYSCETAPTENDELIQRKFKPLERPRIGFVLEHAAMHDDSLWVVVRITIPRGAIVRGECLQTDFRLETPDVLKRLNGLQLFDEKIEKRVVREPYITVSATLQSEKYEYEYRPDVLMIPYWASGAEAWRGARQLMEEDLLDESPVGKLAGNEE